jgi:protein gp37
MNHIQQKVNCPLKKWTGRKTKIQWTTRTWNPCIGCSRCSDGCKACYAILEVHRKQFNPKLKAYYNAGLVTPASKDTPFVQKGELDWTGKVILLPERLEEPLKWEPCFCFVNSLSDLFHSSLTDEEILRVIDTMRRADHVVFQVLTKRAGRLKSFIEKNFPGGRGWPLNVWVGVSVENMATLNRARILASLPLPVKFLSVEPQIEMISGIPEGIHQVLQGGESAQGGHRPRPFDLAWAESMLMECRQKKIAYFLKQMGTTWAKSTAADGKRNSSHDHGGDWNDWPKRLRVREYPETLWNDKKGNIIPLLAKGERS